MREWIACCERVPEPWTQVLCVSAQGRMFVGEYIGITKTGKFNFYTVGGDQRLATHWMVLPERPAVAKSLTLADLDVLKAVVNADGNQRQAARVLGVAMANVNYHVKRISEITGKNPRNPSELMELADMYLGV